MEAFLRLNESPIFKVKNFFGGILLTGIVKNTKVKENN